MGKSLEEMCRLVTGRGTWHIGDIHVSDGPHGIRAQEDGAKNNDSYEATCFPTASSAACSWNKELIGKMGEGLAQEAKALGVSVVLGPGVNMKRSPLCGRNFEYYSEDPFLTGELASSYIIAMQECGVGTSLKHFAGNSQETHRMTSNSMIDERALHEIYLRAFEKAVKKAKPATIMASYNYLNGLPACENKHLLTDILRNDWKYEGLVMSDWGACVDLPACVAAGMDVEMPDSCGNHYAQILEAIQSGKLPQETLETAIKRIERVNTDYAGNILPEKRRKEVLAETRERHHDLAKRIEEESAVLLKNEEQILPLKPGTKVAVIGDFAKTPRYQGAGSSLVNPAKQPEAILDVIGSTDLDVVAYEQGYIRNRKPNQKLTKAAVELAKKADIVLFFGGLDEISESEGLDRTHMSMPAAQETLLNELTTVNKNIIVVLSAGSAIEMPWYPYVKGIVHGYLGGQAGASAMLNVLTGKVNPSGKLNETYPIHYEDTPAYAYYPSKERSSEYRESLYVGYRYYTTVGKSTRFPFGYGLSYTTFEYKDLQIDTEGATFTIKNTGNVSGTEIAQLYVGKSSETVFRPVRELKGFVRVELQPGEEKEVRIGFDDKTFRFYDTRTDSWEIESGTYQIMIGENAQQMVLEGSLNVKGTVENGGYNKEELPEYFSGKIKDISDEKFRILYGREIPDGSWSGEIQMNDAVCQLYYGKGILGKLLCAILKLLLKISDWKGKPNLNVLFNYNMPIRGYAKMTGGIVTMKMAEALTEMANGHRIKGTAHLIKAAINRD